MPNVTHEQLHHYIQAMSLSNEEWKASVLARLDSLVKSNEAAVSGRKPFRETVAISATVPIILDYRDRKYVFIYSANVLTLTLEDLGTIAVAANTWVDISFLPGMFIYAQGQNTTAYVLIVQTDEKPN